tara:strand:- start:589 stop:1230 length:642 start_codon:yes stop_codon:yes gene_type:complete
MKVADIKSFRKKHKLTQEKFSQLLGITKRSVANYEKGLKIPQARIDFIKSIMMSYEDSLNTPEITESATMQIPLVNQYAHAGYLNGFGDQEWVGDLPKIPWILEDNPENFLSFEVRGDSMDDASSESLIEGDLMLCKNLPQDYWSTKLLIHKWDFVIVHKEQGVLVKRISEHNTKTGDLTLHSLNAHYEDVIINIKDVAKLFTIKDYRRSMRR